jgi:phosphatidylglycerol:prolipoprotein diacylglycerol transferase
LSEPLIPYIEAPEIDIPFLDYVPYFGQFVDPIDPPSIKPFGVLVALGVTAGVLIAMDRCRQREIDPNMMTDFITFVVGIGFVVSHVLDSIFYQWDSVVANPWFLLFIPGGLSSYGGFIGAIVGALIWRFVRKRSALELSDICASAFPVAWIFGRTGCAVVHDHPGMSSNAWYAVQFPAHRLQEGFAGRLDLGLIEMVLTIPLAIIVTWLWRRQPKRAAGFYMGLFAIAYAPVRFFLDFLRVQPDDPSFAHMSDTRYVGLTAAQWVCFAAVIGGWMLLQRSAGKPYVRGTEPLK